MAIRAVITGDIVNSTKLGAVKGQRLLKVLRQLLSSYQFEFYRGDSFQVYQTLPAASLKTALLCRTAAISILPAARAARSDIRVSIGIAEVKSRVKSLGTAKGDAFVLSGRAFDRIARTNNRLIIATTNPLANEGLQIIADYINAIFKEMTAKQATIIFELLQGQTQQAIAGKLKKSKSTVSQHVNAGRWPELETLLLHFENIINQII